jgi:type I restriction enzyme S subunit
MLDRVKNRGEPTAYLRNVNVRWGGFDLTDLAEMRMTPQDRDMFQIVDKDVLVCEGGEPGRAAVWRMGPTKVAFQKALMRVRCAAGFQSDLLVAYLRHAQADAILEKSFTGTTIKHLPQGTLRGLTVPVPPSAEQRRIVAKLDALTARTAKARAELDRVPAVAARYKQALLGRSLASDLSGHELVPLRSMLTTLTSGSRDWSPYYDRGTAIFVLAGNVRPMAFDPAARRHVDPPRDAADARRSRLASGDLLLTIVGAGTGDLCAVPDLQGEYYVCQSVALLRLRDPRLSRFLEYWFQSEAHGRGAIDAATYGAARPHLAFDDIGAFPVPDVTLDAAERAVAELDRRFAEIDRLAAEAAVARRLLDRLDRAILAKAFRGELVPQYPDDEPASIMLDRIRAERDAAPGSGRRRSSGAAALKIAP